MATSTVAGVGPLVKEWRARRSRSQMDLALDVGVSTRHLSFVETGKARPSAELVLALAHHLDVPLRERNQMLLAAGFAPRFAETPLDDEAMATVHASLRRVLAAHDPYPGVVLDRMWDVVLANDGATALLDSLPPHVRSPCVNVFRAGLHPDGLAAITENFDEWGAYLLDQLHRLAVTRADDRVRALEHEVHSYPTVQHLLGRSHTSTPLGAPVLLVPCRLRVGDAVLSLFTTLTTFGTPRDVTLDELMIELFFPADDDTGRVLRDRAGIT